MGEPCGGVNSGRTGERAADGTDSPVDSACMGAAAEADFGWCSSDCGFLTNGANVLHSYIWNWSARECEENFKSANDSENITAHKNTDTHIHPFEGDGNLYMDIHVLLNPRSLGGHWKSLQQAAW